MTIRPFEPADLDDAGRMLAARHLAHRNAEPLLSPRYGDAGTARAELDAVLRAEGASGAWPSTAAG